MSTPRQKNGRFASGTSANPAGKPRGQHKTTGLRKELADALPGILQMLVQAASAGDVAAIRLVLERCLPALRPVDSPVAIDMAGNLAEQGQSAIDAVAAGRLAPGQGAQVLAGLVNLAKIIETTDIQTRLAALEAQHAKQ